MNGQANNKGDSDKQQNTPQSSEAKTVKISRAVTRVGGCGCGKRRTL